MKTKIQAFSDILDAVILSAPVCGENVEVTERFTSLGSDIHVSAGCEPEVNSVWVGPGNSLDHGVLALPVPVQDDESPSLHVLGASSLALRM